jgi:hypothetical protein
VFFQGAVQGLNFPSVYSIDFLAAELGQNEPVEHKLIVRHAFGALLRYRMLFHVIHRKVPHGWSHAYQALFFYRVITL